MNRKLSKELVVQDIIFLIAGIVAASIGLKSFLIPNHLELNQFPFF